MHRAKINERIRFSSGKKVNISKYKIECQFSDQHGKMSTQIEKFRNLILRTVSFWWYFFKKFSSFFSIFFSPPFANVKIYQSTQIRYFAAFVLLMLKDADASVFLSLCVCLSLSQSLFWWMCEYSLCCTFVFCFRASSKWFATAAVAVAVAAASNSMAMVFRSLVEKKNYTQCHAAL